MINVNDKYNQIVLNDEDSGTFLKEYTCGTCGCIKYEYVRECEIKDSDEVIECSLTDNYNYGTEAEFGYSSECHCDDEEYYKIHIINEEERKYEVIGWLNVEKIDQDVDIKLCEQCGSSDDIKLIKRGFGDEDINLVCSKCKYEKFIY